MSVFQSSVFNGSVRGWVEEVENGSKVIQVEKANLKDNTRGTILYNVYQLEKGVQKSIYFPCLNPQLREFQLMDGAVIQSADWSSVTAENPEEVTADDLNAYAYESVMRTLCAAVCEEEGLDPALFPPKFTSEEQQTGENYIWYDIPQNSPTSTNPWEFGKWTVSAGIPSFRIKSITIHKSGLNKKQEVFQNHCRVRFSLGREKFNPNKVKKSMPRKKTQRELDELKKAPVASGSGEPAAKRLRVTVPSKAALAKLANLAKEEVVQPEVEMATSD